MLALEYYVHLSGLKRHEETIGSGGCRCAVDVRIKPPYQIDGGVQPHLPPLFHFCYEVRFLGTFVTIRKPGTESLSHEVYYFYLKVPVFVLAYGDQYLFDLTSAIQWVQLIQCIINDIIFFAMASFLQSCRRRMELGFHSIRTHAFDLVLSQNLTLNQHIFLGLILYTEARIIMDQKLGTRIPAGAPS